MLKGGKEDNKMTTTSQDNNNNNGEIPDAPSNFSIDRDLADELLKLSFKDRTAIQEEIHGVRCLAVEETPELIARKLLEFDGKIMEEKIKLGIELRNSLHSMEEARKKNPLRNVQSLSEGSYQVKYLAPPLPLSSPSPNPTLPMTIVIVSTDSVNRICYLNDPNVRLRFLRCETFDVSKAVRRLVCFLELARELFGDYVADRPIRISDFNDRREEVALQNSRNQYLPFRDRSGRRVLVGVGHCDFSLAPELRYKIMLYLHWVVSEDIETQQKGAVIIGWPSNEGNEDDEGGYSWEKSIRPKLNMKHRSFQQRLNDSMPVRVTSQQMYMKDTPFFRALSVMYYIGMDSQNKSIYKAHYGEPTELRYALTGYGIPQQLLPLSNTGTVKTANHSRWIYALRAKAQRETRNLNGEIQQRSDGEVEEIVDCPGSRDVIFRKGPTFKNNPGNMYFRELIESTQDKHTQGSRKEKCNITWNIVNEVLARNGRFLNWSSKKEMWIVATDLENIRKKVAACYKQYNRTVLTFQQQQQQQQQRLSSQKEKFVAQES
mmetsp:Transcript_101/g.244  ORF Transcript_101/g.244 Transcript_101/m.244 type:complete len:546 (-) Transcript_101:313-1950(-)